MVTLGFFRHPEFAPIMLAWSYNFGGITQWPWDDIEVIQRHLATIARWQHYNVRYFPLFQYRYYDLEILAMTSVSSHGHLGYPEEIKTWTNITHFPQCISRSLQDIVGYGCDISAQASLTSSMRSPQAGQSNVTAIPKTLLPPHDMKIVCDFVIFTLPYTRPSLGYFSMPFHGWNVAWVFWIFWDVWLILDCGIFLANTKMFREC